MTHNDILRHSPWLRFVDKFGISSRLLEQTDGDKFVAFNVLHQTYELHSCRAAMLSASSCCASIEPEQVNGFLLSDVKANDTRKFMLDIIADRENMQYLKDKQENARWDAGEQLKKVQRILGTTI